MIRKLFLAAWLALAPLSAAAQWAPFMANGAGATAPPVTNFAALDPANLGTGNTLSNNNLTVTQSGACAASTYCQARTTTTSLTAGKYYFEWVPDSTQEFITIADGSFPLNGSNTCGSTALNCVRIASTFCTVGNTFPTCPTYAAGNTVGIAVDFGAKTLQVRVNGGTFTSISIAALTGGPWYAGTLLGLGSAGVVTMNFGATAYQTAAPAGFSNWPAPSGPPPPTSVPVLAGATFWATAPQASGATVGTLPTAAHDAASCAIAAGNTGAFVISQSGGDCLLKLTGAGLAGAGVADLTITATNSVGTSLARLASVQWHTWTPTTPNIIPASINVVVPNGTTLAADATLGRVGTDTVPGVPPTGCAITAGNTGNVLKTAASANGYHCIIQANTTLAASGSLTLTMTASNGSGTGAAATVPVSWSTLSASAPVVSSTFFSVTTPVAANVTVGTVPVTNLASTDSCALAGDPGNPVPYFTVAAVTNGCQIKTNSALSGSLGAPLLYVTATNSAGTSIGNYASVSLGPIVSISSLPSAVQTAGYTQLVVNDTAMAATQFDTAASRQASQSIHWYGDNSNFPGKPNICDLGTVFGGNGGVYMCDYADIPNFWDTSPKDQANDDLTTGRIFSFSGGVLTYQAGPGLSWLWTCGQFGKEPNNIQYPFVGNAFGGGWYIDINMKFTTTPGQVGGALWSNPISKWHNHWITPLPPSSTTVEIDFMEAQWGDGINTWGYRDGGNTGTIQGFTTSSLPTDGNFHHYQVLVVPSFRTGGNGTVTWWIDGAQKASVSYNSSSTNPTMFGLDSQLTCFSLSAHKASPILVSSYQVWQHP